MDAQPGPLTLTSALSVDLSGPLILTPGQVLGPLTWTYSPGVGSLTWKTGLGPLCQGVGPLSRGVRPRYRFCLGGWRSRLRSKNQVKRQR